MQLVFAVTGEVVGLDFVELGVVNNPVACFPASSPINTSIACFLLVSCVRLIVRSIITPRKLGVSISFILELKSDWSKNSEVYTCSLQSLMTQ